MMKHLFLALAVMTVTLGTSVSAEADHDPYIGKWRAIDADYSHWKLTITAREVPGEYYIDGRDNKNTNCDNKPALAYGPAVEGLVEGNAEGTLLMPGLYWNVVRDCVTVDNPSGGGVQPLWLESDGTLWMNQGPNYRLVCIHQNNDPHACPPLEENDFGWWPGG